MSIQALVRELRVISAGRFPRTAFLTMFIGVVVAPLALFVAAGRDQDLLGQHGLFWYFLALSLFLLMSIGIGSLLFRHDSLAARDLSINPHSD